jgi:hypothetical protein
MGLHLVKHGLPCLKIINKEFIPHPTFDLDGDGIVGGRDLAISKLFDQDKDGRLNTQEKK